MSGSVQQVLEESFLDACKNGNMMLLEFTISQRADVNCRSGYGLRRAVRYNQTSVWRFLLERSDLEINLQNSHGQSALHTAARFNIPEAAVDILQRSDVDFNLRSSLGSSAAMVAAKYASKETLNVLINDPRVRLDVVDNKKRKMEDVIGASMLTCDKNLDNSLKDAIFNSKVKKLFCEIKCGNVKNPPLLMSSPEICDEGYLSMNSIVLHQELHRIFEVVKKDKGSHFQKT